MKLHDFVKGFSLSKNENLIEDSIMPIKDNIDKSKNKNKVINLIEEPKGSYIAKDVVIKGLIECVSDITIAGRVLDNVFSKGDIKLLGSIEGDCVESKNLELHNACLNGNIIVSEGVTVSKNSKVTGNIVAEHIDVAGVVEGNITVTGNALIRNGAGIFGNISVGSFTVENGAKISGLVMVIDKKTDKNIPSNESIDTIK